MTAASVVPITSAPSYVPEPLSLASYLDGVEWYLRRFVAFPSDNEAAAVSLWIAHAWFVEQFETSPLLAVTSAEKQSGKSRLLECIELLAPNALKMVLPSEAVVYTLLAEPPRKTLLLDEVDTVFAAKSGERFEGLRAILNSGNRRGSPVARVKMDGRRRSVEYFDVFGPKVLAGIGDLPPTVADRAIPIRMKRRAPHEDVERFRLRDAKIDASAITLDRTGLVFDVERTQIPPQLPDRAADSWEPLLAIADAAGGEWPPRARRAAVVLSSDEPSTETIGQKLLADIREVFGQREYLATEELLMALHDVPDAPWSEWYGKPLTGRGLAVLLDRFRVGPQQRRIEGGTKIRGYFRTDLEDVWERYLSRLDPLVPVPQGMGEGPALWSDEDSSG